MCGRFALTAPASTIAEIFQVDVLPDLLPRYNVAPTTPVACVLAGADGKRELQTLRWGLVPSWAKDPKIAYQTINARADSIATKAAFRAPFKRRRCLVLADGFYEWERIERDPEPGSRKKAKITEKIPHLIGMADGRPFAMAGVWDRWIQPDTGEEMRSCSIVTTGPNDLMVPIHNRMPVILPAEQWDTWLDPAIDDKARLLEMLVPYPAEGMRERRVSKAVGNVKNKGPEVQGPYEEDGS